MFVAAGKLWRLSDGGADSLGLSCTADGLFRGGTALVECRGRGYAVRARRDLERLFRCAYGSAAAVGRVLPGLALVASSLAERNLCLAQIAAVHLTLPDLPDMLARASVESEDRLIKAEQTGDILNRAGWDPAEHPRAGVPPNPGWFAPTDGSPVQTAQGEENERAPEEMADPLAEVREARWNAAIARLREIDPANPNLAYLANRDTPPSEAAIGRLDAVVEAAAIKRTTEKVMPGGVLIGTPEGRHTCRYSREASTRQRICSNIYESAET